MGDSHVKRLYEHRRTCSRLNRISMDWRGRGGAGIRFVEENIEQTSKAKMVILMIGGNDIDNGMPVLKLVDRLEKVAKAILREGLEVVGIASIWPRQDTRFNKKIN